MRLVVLMQEPNGQALYALIHRKVNSSAIDTEIRIDVSWWQICLAVGISELLAPVVIPFRCFPNRAVPIGQLLLLYITHVRRDCCR